MTHAPDGLDPKHVWDALFWADVENDAALKDCSPAAQGFWMTRMLPICARAKRRGYFLHNGAPPTIDQLVKWSGYARELIPELIEELGRKGVYSVDADGIIYNRRIVRQELKKAAGTKPEPTEKELADRAIKTMLEQDAKDGERKAKQRSRQARYAQKKRDDKARAAMEAFDAMAAAAQASDASVSERQQQRQQSRQADVIRPFADVSKGEQTQSVDATSLYLNPNPNLDKPLPPGSAAGSLATLPGGSPAERDEGQGSPGRLQSRIASRFAPVLIQAPNESDEAFAARCAQRSVAA